MENPFTDKATFNWKKFKKDVGIAQKLMDDVIDLEEEKINKILDKIENDPEDDKIKQIEKDLWIKIRTKLLQGRRTGLSAIGLGDTFAALNLQYGSDDSIKLADKIYKEFAISAYISSVDMAEDRGAFPIWDLEKSRKNPFIQRVFKDSGYSESYAIFGTRNIALLTEPPSGTISNFPKITSGIEPVYQLSYKRRRKVDENHPKKSFKDQNGDWWEEYTIHHREGKEEFYKGSTAYELDPIQRVKLQGVIQRWVDHSINYCALIA